MNRQQAEKVFNEAVKKGVYDHTHQPTQSPLVDEAQSAFGVGHGQGLSDLGAWPGQGDFVTVLASVRSAVLDLLEEAGVLKGQ